MKVKGPIGAMMTAVGSAGRPKSVGRQVSNLYKADTLGCGKRGKLGLMVITTEYSLGGLVHYPLGVCITNG